MKEHEAGHKLLQGNVRQYPIGIFSKLTGVTERTLRFYDRKGLLQPSSRNEYGHRYYTDRDLMQLQKILTLKYMDFSLDDISTFLNQPQLDFAQSLSLQAELLEQKRKQLDHVLDTIVRTQALVEGADKVDADLMLLLIGSLQHERKQKEWMMERMPSAFVNAIFMEHMKPDKKLEVERQMTMLFMRLRELHKRGREPLDDEVLEAGKLIMELLLSLVGPAVKELGEAELALMEALNEEEYLDPLIFKQIFDADEELFLGEVFKHLNTWNTLKGEKTDEND